MPFRQLLLKHFLSLQTQKTALDFPAGLRDNPTVEREHNFPEPLSPIAKRCIALDRYFETTTDPTLHLLDEYINVSIEYYEQEHQKGDNQERTEKILFELKKAAHGTYLQEKRIFCLTHEAGNLNLADELETEGEPEQAEQLRASANNWQKLAQLCRQQPPGI